MIEQKPKDLIDKKASEQCPETALKYVSTYVKQLNDHIDKKIVLSESEIDVKVDILCSYTTISLTQPLNDELGFLRARRSELSQDPIPEVKWFTTADDLSYIKNPTKDFPSQGRLNKTGESLFYAAVIVKKNWDALGVVLSEARAKKLDRMNILRSEKKVNTDLNVYVMGMWDCVRLEQKPYYFPDTIFAYYKDVYNYTKNKFDSNLFLAYQLTDRFLADIFSRKGSESLYQVTSRVGCFLLHDSNNYDGILYSSVEAKGEPVIVLKPKVVDLKLEHKSITNVEVEDHYGYEHYEAKTIQKISIK